MLPGDISGVNENTPDTTLFLFVDLYVFTYVYAAVGMCTYVHPCGGQRTAEYHSSGAVALVFEM